ncbi:ComEA family DNA-binding protein [Bacillus sp. JJ1562]|uniref:ComEA family DNA-binding protein n=1 Tax=Bacillus sp. JJ1562 TaxID=3122960 RepID=UPI0030026F52
MFKSHANRGKGWEWLQSWWMIFVLAPFGVLTFFSFFYVGFRVRNVKWILYALIYLGAFIFAMTNTDSGIGALVAISSWIIAIVHVIRIRSVFLIQLEVIKEMEHEKNEKIREEAKRRLAKRKEFQSEQRVKQTADKEAEPKTAPKIEPDTKTPPIPEVEKMDLNTATKEEIASIPAIGLILAKRIVAVRQEIGGYQSFEQFVQTIGIKQHTAEKIKHRVEFSQTEKSALPYQSGRRVDF